MTTLPDLVPPWSSIPLVNDDTRLFPEPTMTAVAAAVTEAVVASPELSVTIGEKVQPVANDVVATAVTAQDIPGKVATATGAAITDANIPALVDEAAGPAVTAEATEQLPALVTAEVALRVPPAVDTAITGADIPGKVAIALAAQAGKILQGTGMPNGVVTATPGTLYVDTASTNGASVWRKATGTGSTGWVVLSGDTGWRNLNGAINTPWVPAQLGLLFRRTTDSIHLVISANNPAPDNSIIMTCPLGYRPGKTMSYLYQGVSQIVFSESGSLWYQSAPSNLRYAGVVPAAEAWPTTLPGTPA